MDTESKKEEIRHKALFLLDMKSETKKELIIYGSIILAIILIRTFIVTPVRVNGTSMYSTLNDGEIMILNKINYKFTDIKNIIGINFNVMLVIFGLSIFVAILGGLLPARIAMNKDPIECLKTE